LVSSRLRESEALRGCRNQAAGFRPQDPIQTATCRTESRTAMAPVKVQCKERRPLLRQSEPIAQRSAGRLCKYRPHSPTRAAAAQDRSRDRSGTALPHSLRGTELCPADATPPCGKSRTCQVQHTKRHHCECPCHPRWRYCTSSLTVRNTARTRLLAWLR
jgi:hypothetical protein